MKKILIILFMSLSFLGYSQHKCGAPTKMEQPCKKPVKVAGQHCFMHGGQSSASVLSVQCAANTDHGRGPRCKRKTLSGEYCSSHKNQK